MRVSRRQFVGGVVATAGAVGMSAGGRRAFGANAAGEVEVVTPLGRLRGETEAEVRVFRGVPFAQPPVGALRFRAPEPVKEWSGVREATRFAAAAMQHAERGVAVSEDCLYLNVWAPEAGGAAGKGPWPVFVWIHGGGYTGGQSFAPVFDGAEFARAGMVLVTVAYRLGVFGYMDLEPLLGAGYVDSANNGTRDLVEALRWVHANVASFGGDPGRVTVGGESAGAKSTGTLMAVPEAAGLFQSAISESGGGERVLLRAASAAVAAEYAALWKADGGTVAGLGTADAGRLIAVQERYLQAATRHFPFRVEVGPLPDGKALLPEVPIAALQRAGKGGKRLLIGTNRDESALFVGPKPSGVVQPNELGNLTLEAFNKVYARYPAVYPEMAESQREVRAVTAEEYWVPSVRLAEANVRNGGATWMYRLDWAKTKGRMAGEAYHSEDVDLVWDKVSAEEQTEPGATVLAGQMHAAWVAFIKGEAPAAGGLVAWPEFELGKRRTMVLDTVSRVEERPQARELALWDGVM